jgi:hypothetical protein
VVGQVVGVHLDEAFVVPGRVDAAALQPIARCGHLDGYARPWTGCFAWHGPARLAP